MITVMGHRLYLNDIKLAIWLGTIFFFAFLIPIAADEIAFSSSEPYASAAFQRLWSAVIFATLASFSTLTFGLDSKSLESRGGAFPIRLAFGLFAGGAVLILLASKLPSVDADPLLVLASLVIAFFATLATRQLAAQLLVFGSPPQRIMIVGTGKCAVEIQKMIGRSPKTRYQCIGFYQANKALPSLLPTSSKVFDEDRSLFDIASEHNVSEIVVALDDRRGAFPIESLLAAKLTGIAVTDLVSFYERECLTIKFEQLHPSWIIFSNDFRLGRSRRLAKRAFDLMASGTMLILTAPLLLLVSAASLLESRGRHSILYSQERVGLGGLPFRLHKFRSMVPDAEADGQARWAGPHDDRVTSLGRILRRYRLDELPQLLNIIKGDMSLVGPRPERPEFVAGLAREIPFYNERHCVPPGLTGWAQLMYPYGASVEDAKRKLEYDLYYIKHTSIVRDFVILLRTLEVVVSGRGVH